MVNSSSIIVNSYPKTEHILTRPTQPCPMCGTPIGTVAGSKEAICPNCGFKDPCCE